MKFLQTIKKTIMIRAYSHHTEKCKISLGNVPSCFKSYFNDLKICSLFIVLILSSFSGMAQRQFDPQTMELIKTKKIAFLTEQIGLTSQEAERFWPIYNELDKQRLLIMEKKRDLEHSCETSNPALTESDYRRLAVELASAHSKEGKLIEEYNLKLLNILPAEKVVKLYLAEGRFRATLMQEFRKSQQDKKETEFKK
jgi:hypothetical protein